MTSVANLSWQDAAIGKSILLLHCWRHQRTSRQVALDCRELILAAHVRGNARCDGIEFHLRRVMRAHVSRISSSTYGSAHSLAMALMNRSRKDTARISRIRQSGGSPSRTSQQPINALNPFAFSIEAAEKWALEEPGSGRRSHFG